MDEKKYEIVVFGATSFVGQILCHYLSEHYPDLSWAVAGRSVAKLDSLCQSLPGGDTLPRLVADASDEPALTDLCEQTQVVISTVGPYALYGEPLIKACTSTGTDYCDLTGEPQWIQRMIRQYESAARQSGARIVHCCGFDSIPSDMGVYFLEQQAKARFGKPCTRVKMRVKALRGGASGGTYASMVNLMKEASDDPELRRSMANPYSLCPDDYQTGVRQPNVKLAEYDPDMNAWTAPFVMGAINTRVVQRSNALSDQAYGNPFRYDEAVLTGTGIKGRLSASSVALGLGGFMATAALAPGRWLLEKLLPAPGEGPSQEEQEKGFYDLRFIGKTDDGQTLIGKVTGDRDPGYGSTSKMLAQAALCLAQDISKEDKAGGFWTPATVFGDKLIERLQAHAGLTFTLMEN